MCEMELRERIERDQRLVIIERVHQRISACESRTALSVAIER
jgi:hypothetical protein